MDNTKEMKNGFCGVYRIILTSRKKGAPKKKWIPLFAGLRAIPQNIATANWQEKTDFETFFFCPGSKINPNASKITGVICGYRVEEIKDKLMQKIRYMDKLIDELAKGKAMEKILQVTS